MPFEIDGLSVDRPTGLSSLISHPRFNLDQQSPRITSIRRGVHAPPNQSSLSLVLVTICLVIHTQTQ